MTDQNRSSSPSQPAIERLLSAPSDLILQSLHEAVILTDLDGTVRYWNDAATRLFGWTADEMLGRPYVSRFPNDKQAWLQQEIQKRAAGVEWDGEFEDLRKDGSTIYIRARVRRILDSAGVPIAILGISQDITEQRQAEQAAQTNAALERAVLDSIPAHVAVLTSDGTIRAINQAWRLLAYSAVDADTLGKTPLDVGSNYVRRCEDDPMHGPAVAVGIREVLCGQRRSFEHEYLQIDASSKRWFRMTVSPLNHPSGGAVVAHTDISERVRSETTSHTRNEQLRLALQAADMGVWLQDLTSREFTWSPEVSHILQFGGESVTPKMANALVHPLDREHLAKKFAACVADRSRLETSFRIVRQNGEVRWLHVFGQVQLGRTGQPERIVGALKDVTQSRLAKQAVLRQNRVLQQIVEWAPLSDVLAEVATQIEQELPGTLCSILVADRSSNVLRHGAAPSLADAYNTAIDGIAIREGCGACGTAAFRREPVLVRDTQLDPLFSEYRQLAANHALRSCLSIPLLSEDLVGDSGEILLGTFALYRADTDDTSEAFQTFAQTAVQSQLRAPSAAATETGDADRRASLASMQNILACAVHLARLAIERQAALQALKDSEERFRLLVDGVADYAVLLVDAVGRIQTWNAGAARIFGYAADEMVGSSFERLFTPEEVAVWAQQKRWEQLDREGRIELEGWRLRKDGSRLWVTTVARVLHDVNNKVRGYTIVVRDLTERRELEAQLRQSQKMDAIGRLAGGVAHDFNNLLMVILGYAERLLNTASPSDPVGEAVLAIRDASERAASLTSQLLAFSRKAIVEPKLLDLNAVARSASRMLKRLLGEDIHLTTEIASEPTWIKLDPGQLDQIFMNLAVNAREAMPRGGSLHIKSQSVVLRSALHGEFGDLPSGAYAKLSVRDSGSGIPENLRPHIFEPFFTTKSVGNGTGLGLATVYGIVRQAGGAIRVDSQVGKGSEFHVFFPLYGAAPGLSPPPNDAPVRGTETILVVEDEDSVRQVVHWALEMHGYKILTAASGRAGVELAAAHPGEIHLLITDVVMPELSGSSLAKAVCQQRPGTKVLYISGYTDDAVVQHGVEASTVAFLQKPFSPHSLARKVREVLDHEYPRTSGPPKG